MWNIEISAAFWGPIHGIEIAIRNAVHAALAEHFHRADWWNAAAIDPGLGQKARTQERELASTSSPVRADDVVAALSFGFWSAVLASPKNALEQNRYWQQCLHRAFPGWSHKPNDAAARKAFTRRIELLRKFRNRVAHHEPIHTRDLAADHERILTLAGFIHPDLAAFLHAHSRVPHVLTRYDDAVTHGLCHF